MSTACDDGETFVISTHGILTGERTMIEWRPCPSQSDTPTCFAA